MVIKGCERLERDLELEMELELEELELRLTLELDGLDRFSTGLWGSAPWNGLRSDPLTSTNLEVEVDNGSGNAFLEL